MKLARRKILASIYFGRSIAIAVFLWAPLTPLSVYIFASVMGLPVCHVIRLMRQMDLQPNAEFFVPCETLLEYQCPVSNAIM